MLPCNGCAYRRSIPGNCHSQCAFDWKSLPPEAFRTVSENANNERVAQWFMFPFNFDPVWGPDECPARSEVSDDSKIAEVDPLVSLLMMMR